MRPSLFSAATDFRRAPSRPAAWRVGQRSGAVHSCSAPKPLVFLATQIAASYLLATRLWRKRSTSPCLCAALCLAGDGGQVKNASPRGGHVEAGPARRSPAPRPRCRCPPMVEPGSAHRQVSVLSARVSRRCPRGSLPRNETDAPRGPYIRSVPLPRRCRAARAGPIRGGAYLCAPVGRIEVRPRPDRRRFIGELAPRSHLQCRVRCRESLHDIAKSRSVRASRYRRP